MPNKVIEILTKVGAVLSNGHFVGTSGKHFDAYLNKDALFPHTAETSKICSIIARSTKHLEIDIVAAPALGGLFFSQWVAHHLSRLRRKEILATFTEKTSDNDQVFTRGYDKLIKGKKVLVVEDFVTTGNTVRKVVKGVNAAGGKVVAVCVLVNKDNKNVSAKTFSATLITLADFAVENYDANRCPMCKKNVPVNTAFGHGKKFAK